MSVYFEDWIDDWFEDWYSTLTRTEQNEVEDIAFYLGFIDEYEIFDPSLLTYEELNAIYDAYYDPYW